MALPNASAATFREYLAIQGRLIKATRALREVVGPDPDDWEAWLEAVFSRVVRPPYASYHRDFWRHAWSFRAGEPASTYVAIWPRGFGKSTSVEVLAALVAARRTRSYVLYVSSTQSQANDHVSNVAALLESDAFAKYFPATARRQVSKYGHSKGWTRSRLRTADGFVVDAIGLDTASRGAKVGAHRPDLIICDDVDELFDTPATVDKKIRTLTKSIIPSLATHGAVIFAQNLIHSNGIVARLADGRADFLTDRIVSGPHPAIADLVTTQVDGKTKIVSGTPTWEGRTLAALQALLDAAGLSAFLAELQQEVRELEGGMFSHIEFQRIDLEHVPPLEDVQVWVDPAVTDTKRSDSHGIQVDGIANGLLYRLFSWEGRTSPEDSLKRAILMGREWGASSIGIETDQGGDTWFSTYELTWRKLVDAGEIEADERMIPMDSEKAGAGYGSKAQRASQMLAAYERGEIIHVIGTHPVLETALRRYLLIKPYDLVDASYWGWHGLTRAPKEVNIW